MHDRSVLADGPQVSRRRTPDSPEFPTACARDDRPRVAVPAKHGTIDTSGVNLAGGTSPHIEEWVVRRALHGSPARGGSPEDRSTRANSEHVRGARTPDAGERLLGRHLQELPLRPRGFQDYASLANDDRER